MHTVSYSHITVVHGMGLIFYFLFYAICIHRQIAILCIVGGGHARHTHAHSHVPACVCRVQSVPLDEYSTNTCNTYHISCYCNTLFLNILHILCWYNYAYPVKSHITTNYSIQQKLFFFFWCALHLLSC